MGDSMKPTTTPSSASINRSLIGEIVPGLWIGNLQSVKELAKMTDRKWTVVSVLKSSKLSLFVEKVIDEIRKEQQHQHPEMIQRTEEWTLADQSCKLWINPSILTRTVNARVSSIVRLASLDLPQCVRRG
jgi:hypothetical protein